MASKKHGAGFVSTIMRLIMMGTGWFGFVGKLTALIRYESQVARKKLISIIIVSCLMAALLLSIWFCLLGLLFTYLISLQFSIMIALSILLLINFIMFLILGLILFKLQKNLFFPLTRTQLSKLTG